MAKKNFGKVAATWLSLAALTVLVGCSGGSSSSGGSSWGAYQSPYITASSFVNALNDVDNRPLYDENYIELYTDETYRTYEPGQEEWFVIWDAKYDEYKAVSLQYIRSIVYYDYYSNDYAVADEFREIESDDIWNGDINGDYWGDDYEVVDYDGYTDSFWGRNSGYEYEDDGEVYDTSLMAGEAEKKEFLKKASKISFAYQMDIETSLSLVSLGSKVEKMVGQNGEISAEDQQALVGDLEDLTKVSFAEVLAAGNDEQAKKDVLEKIANNIGTSADSLQNRILPELLGVEL